VILGDVERRKRLVRSKLYRGMIGQVKVLGQNANVQGIPLGIVSVRRKGDSGDRMVTENAED